MPNPDSVQIAPAEGKLGVLIPGMGAVTTTFIAGLEAIKRGIGEADRFADATGNRPAGKADRRPQPGDQGFRAAGAASKTWKSAAGTSSRTTPTRRR